MVLELSPDFFFAKFVALYGLLPFKEGYCVFLYRMKEMLLCVHDPLRVRRMLVQRITFVVSKTFAASWKP